MGSETTAAAAGEVGNVRRDPMAMLPFCGYHMADYFHHWLDMRRDIRELPRIFHVNWFRKDEDGNWLWPGFSENMRVLEWIVKRCHGQAAARETSIGWMPAFDEFEFDGMDNFTEADFERVMAVNDGEFLDELLSEEAFSLTLRDRLPKELIFQRELLASRL